MPPSLMNTRIWPVALLTLGSTACWPVSDPAPEPNVISPEIEEQIDREVGDTSFLSADGAAGQSSPTDKGNVDDAGQGTEGTNEPAPGAPAADGDRTVDDGERSVEEGDIYRVMPGGLIANLNAYRGLQIIDINDVDHPRIVGRLQISGSPVEMYVDGDRVFVLMNNWYGYYGLREDLSSLGQWNGGVVAAIDIADPTQPALIDQRYVKGSIAKSRLTKGNVSRALYVAASAYDYYELAGGGWNYESHTVVKSFDVADGSIRPKSEIDLGGYVTDIQATNRALLVARYDWSWDPVENHENGTFLSVIDITSPEGVMVEGDEIEVAGYVDNQFRMDLRGDVLRVASGSSWGSNNTNHLETFDASDLGDLIPIDHVTYGDGEQLFGTLFLEDKAFAVTYLRVDPFHAFSITPDGYVTEESEFIVSGWNDFFRATFNESRLVGIGVNDEQGRSMSVSLYDITDLQNANPLLARAEVQADYSWSEASWDHRAFSILENVVSVSGPSGEDETGLVLLPFSGYLTGEQRYAAAVQIFTFSENSLTRRGLMEHGTQVRRSFAANDSVTANLSEASLSLFGTADPDQPVSHGRVDLAPNYTDVLVFGDYRARVQRRADDYGWWYDTTIESPKTFVDIIDSAAELDTAEPIARLEVPAAAQLYAAGDVLITVESKVLDYSDYPYTYETTVTTYDLSDPTMPTEVGQLITDRLTPGESYNYYGGPAMDDCMGCGYYGSYAPQHEVFATDDALAFLRRDYEQELLGTERICNTYANEASSCRSDTEECTYIEGGITCRQSDPAEEPYCEGQLRRCTYRYVENQYEYDCEAVDEDSVSTETYCWDNDNYRYWTTFSLEVLDVRDPASPSLLDTLALPVEDEAVALVQDKSTLWASYKRPVDVPGTSLPYVRYFVRRIDLGDLDDVALGSGINVPGELLAADGDTLITRDYLWGEEIIETSLNRVELNGALASLEALHTFERELVQQVVLDGAGRALVTHQLAWPFIQTNDDYVTKLSILDADGDMSLSSTTAVDAWAQLKDARAGRALFQVSGGLLVLNLDDDTSPWAQAFFALRGWPSRVIVTGDEVVVPAGQYGVYRFGLDTFNLLNPEP